MVEHAHGDKTMKGMVAFLFLALAPMAFSGKDKATPVGEDRVFTVQGQQFPVPCLLTAESQGTIYSLREHVPPSLGTCSYRLQMHTMICGGVTAG